MALDFSHIKVSSKNYNIITWC